MLASRMSLAVLMLLAIALPGRAEEAPHASRTQPAAAPPQSQWHSIFVQLLFCMDCGAGNLARSRLSAGPSDFVYASRAAWKGGCGQDWPPHILFGSAK